MTAFGHTTVGDRFALGLRMSKSIPLEVSIVGVADCFYRQATELGCRVSTEYSTTRGLQLYRLQPTQQRFCRIPPVFQRPARAVSRLQQQEPDDVSTYSERVSNSLIVLQINGIDVDLVLGWNCHFSPLIQEKSAKRFYQLHRNCQLVWVTVKSNNRFGC
jgi:hypothetical protein